MVWYYQDVDFDFGSCQAKVLLGHLANVLTNEPVMVRRGKRKGELANLKVMFILAWPNCLKLPKINLMQLFVPDCLT